MFEAGDGKTRAPAPGRSRRQGRARPHEPGRMRNATLTRVFAPTRSLRPAPDLYRLSRRSAATELPVNRRGTPGAGGLSTIIQ